MQDVSIFFMSDTLKKSSFFKLLCKNAIDTNRVLFVLRFASKKRASLSFEHRVSHTGIVNHIL